MTQIRGLLVAVPILLVAAGCSVIAGVSFGDAHESTTSLSPAPGDQPLDEDGSVVETPKESTGGCTAEQKLCNGACVSKADPAYGCEATECLPCSVQFTNNATCKAGKCAADTCAANHGDCDNVSENGCEASLDSPASCRACGTVCNVPTSLCSPTGCVSSCPAGTTECNGACIDTKTNLDNCGTCGHKCAAPTNGDPICVNSTCGFSCRTGFGDCANNPATACNALPKFYADADGDGYGSAVSVQACTPPAGYVANSGDCLDSNGNVHPNQASFFGTSFINAVGAESYDYDCSGVEVDSAEHWPGSCDGDCSGFGNLPKSPARGTPGANQYCGSTATRFCVDTGGSSGQIPNQKGRPHSSSLQVGGCQARAGASGAVGCH